MISFSPAKEAEDTQLALPYSADLEIFPKKESYPMLVLALEVVLRIPQ